MPAYGTHTPISTMEGVTRIASLSWQVALALVVALVATGLALSHRASAAATDVSPALVDINTNLAYQGSSAAGTGIVLTSDGRVLTNNHVIKGATTIHATDVGNGRTYLASVVGYDVQDDIAVLQLKGASGLQAAGLGSSGSAKRGDVVAAIGNAGGAGGTPSVSSGRITALNQSITAGDGNGDSERLTGLIGTDATLVPGDSGGALVDSSGRVLGMLTAASRSGGFQFEFQGQPQSTTRGYAIPVAKALLVVDAIVAGKGSARIHVGSTALLGITLQQAASYGDSGYYGQIASGAAVTGLLQTGAAARAGLAYGDVITALGGNKVKTPSDVTKALLVTHPGDTIKIGWTDSAGTHHTGTARLGSGPPQ